MTRGTLLFKFLCIFTAVLYFAAPVLAQAAQAKSSDYAQGRADGEAAAKGSGLWFFGGFCLGLVGVVLAYSLKPSPSAESLIGQNPDYVLGYTDGYKSKASKKNGGYALGGLALLVAVYAVLLTTADLDSTNN